MLQSVRMVRNRVLFGVVLAFVACMVAGRAVPTARAEEEELDLQVIQDGIDGCLNADTTDGRLGCYANLCAPGYHCAEAMLRAATTSGGPTLATTVLNDIMTVHQQYAVFTDGHELSHVIGRQLAKEFGSSGDAFMRCPRDFYYGCQHGFFEIVLATSPSPVEAALSVCESAPEDQRFFCYHGVGHGFMMSYAYDLDDVLSKCNELPEAQFKRQGCWQGSFMENINSYLRGEARDGVFNSKDPLGPCNRLEQQYRWECYFNQASFLLRINNNDVAKASAACMAADEASRPACTRGIGQLIGNPGWQKVILGDDVFTEAALVPNAIQLCESFPKSEQGNCITGMIENMLNYDQEPDALRVCSLLAEYEGQRSGCYRDFGAALQRMSYPREKYMKYCPQFPQEYRSACDPTGTKSVPPPQENIVLRIVHAIGGFFSWLWHGFTGLFAVSENVPLLPIGTVASSSLSSSDASTVTEPLQADAVFQYDNGEFSPAEVTIRRGQTVTWVNDGEDPFWPASDDHPTHQVYNNGAFDPKRPILPGDSWSFTFDTVGDWEFHDHLYPIAIGVVHVED